VKALSIRQPYAAAILAGLKQVEYRSWPTRFRGTLLIHASASRGSLDQCEQFPTLDPTAFPFGALVGTVEVVDCTDGGDAFDWHLANPVAFPPIPYKGAVGLFNVLDEAYLQRTEPRC
jgi:hypothetical protein